MSKKSMKNNLMLEIVQRKMSKKIFLLLTTAFLIGCFFVVKMVFAEPIFSVTATTSAVDVGQTKDLTFNVLKAEGGTALKTIAISEVGTGFSNPTSIVCPEGWNIISSMPPIVNGYICNDPNGVGLNSASITLKGMVAPMSTGTKDFSISVINTDSTENGGPKTENVKTQIVVKNLTATATISPTTTNINQERIYTLNLKNNSSNSGDDIAQINGTLTNFNITSCSATGWTTCVPSENSFILSGSSLAPENSINISITAVAPAVSGSQNISAQITGSLGGSSNVVIDQNVIQVQTPANLTISNLSSDKNYISKNNGAINSTTVSLDIINNGQAIANNLVKTLAIKDISGVDVSDQFVITETTASTTEILGNETKTLSWIITANENTNIEAVVKADVSINYNDINTENIATASPAIKTNNQIFTVDNTAPIIASHADEIIEATDPSGAIVKYIAPNATDNFDSSVIISSCLPASDSMFSIGSTTITCASSDKVGNIATPVSFIVNVLDTVKPIITNIMPISGSSSTNVIPTISAQFIEAGSGINKSKTILFIDGNDVTEFTTITDSNILYISPFELYVGFHNVTINISDNAGNDATRSWQFAIINPVAVIASLSATQWPTDNTIGIDLNAHPYIQFSKLMNESTLIAGNIEMRLYDAQTTVVNSTITFSTVNDATRVTFISNSNLIPNTKYFFYLGAGVKDLAGNFLDATWTTANKSSHEFTSRVLYTSWNISLNQGWNLISLPLIPNNNAISTVLASISSKVAIAKYYDAITGSWLSYIPGIGGTLTTIEDGKGYWINMNSAGTLNITGAEMPVAGEFPPIYSVIENKWNLIGFKSVVNMTTDDYINSYIDKTSYNNGIVWNYKAGQYLSTNMMESGYGYWLFMK